MNAVPESRMPIPTESLCRAASAIVTAVGCLVLIGWTLDITVFKSVSSSWVTMKANTAFGFILAGVSLWLLGERTDQAAISNQPANRLLRRLGQGCAGLTLLIGLLTIMEYLSGWDLGVDNILFVELPGALETSHFGRMSPTTALGFFCSGLALLMLDRTTRRNHRPAQFIILPPLAASLFGALGYLYGIPALYGVASFTSMAAHTAATFIILGFGILLARPTDGWMRAFTARDPRSIVTRRLAPAAIVIPVLIGWLRMEGQRAGFYGVEFGLALTVMTTVIMFLALIWWTGEALQAADAKRQQTEAALRESELRFRRAVSEAPIPMLIHDEEGRIELISQGWTQFSGYTTADIPTIADWIEGAYQERREFAEYYLDDLRLINETQANGEWEIRAKDGSKRIWDFYITPLSRPANGKRLLLNLAVDVTKRKEFESQISRLNAELEQRVRSRTAQLEEANSALRSERLLIEAIRQAQAEFILTESPQTMFDGLLNSLLNLSESQYGFIDELFYTPEGTPYLTARAITDVSWSDETRKMYARFLSGELHFTNLKTLFGEVMTTGLPVIANDVPTDPRRGGTPAGHPALKAFLGLPLHSNNKFVGVLGLANRPGGYTQEIIAYLQPLVAACANLLVAWENERERLQGLEKFRALNSELEHRSAQLEAANQELEAFSYSVSHDLRAPLRSIDGFSQALLEDYSERLDAQGLDNLQRVIAGSQRMSQLIDDLLLLSRVTRSEIRRETVDLSSLAEIIVADLRKALPEPAKEVQIAANLRAEGDARLLRIVLENLLGNAWKFTRRQPNALIEVGVRPQDGKQAFYIRDNGAGFDMAYADKLFGAFQRLHSVREFEGTGIGLATVQRIIHRHSGRVWAEGDVGRGATFYFTL